jgi:PAS domain S-box-containing protein
MTYHGVDASTAAYPDLAATLSDIGLPDRSPAPALGRIARLAASALGAPIAMLSLIDGEIQLVLSSAGLLASQTEPYPLPQPSRFCQSVQLSRKPLPLADARAHPLAPDGVTIHGRDVVAYLGVPLLTLEGAAVGALCAIDTTPRAWNAGDLAALQDLAALAASEIDLRSTIAEGQRREAALRTEAARMRALSELTSNYVFSLGLNADGELVNEWMLGIFTRITGYTLQELGTRGLWEQLFHPDDVAIVRRMHAAARAGQTYDQEFRIITKSGETRWIREYGRPEWDTAHGRFVRILGAAQDITEKKRAEEAVRASQAELLALFAAMQDVILVIDGQGCYRKIAPSNPDLLYRPAPELVGKTLHEVFPPEQADVFLAHIRQALDSGRPVAYTYCLPVREGWRWFASTIARMDADTVVMIARDVTAQRQAEDAIRFQAHLLDHVEQAVMAADLEGRITFWNRFAEKLFGWRQDEALGQNVFELIVAEPWESGRVARQMQSLRSGSSQSAEYLARRRDGTVFPIWGISAPLRNEAGEIIGTVGVSTDISERKRAEAALRESEERYRLIAENTSDLISMLDEHGCYIYASPSYRQVTGYEPADLIGLPSITHIHPEDHAMLREEWKKQIGGQGITHITFRYRHADGSWRWCEATETSIERQGLRIMIGVGRDVTERKRLESQLQHAQKMESIGRLAGGVAHDFNNLLAAIIGYADLVEEALPPDTSARSDLAEIQKAARRAANLTRQLLAFARRQVFAPHVLNLSDLILDMDKLLRRLIGEDIELSTLPGANLLPIKADPGQIEQVLVNLAVNARDAMPEGGKLIIETTNVVLDTAYAHKHIGVAPGRYVLLSVSDTGIGMSEEVKHHLFEPFYTTKEQGKGTGLGLATCYGIVKQHGGNIWAYSELGYGTTIKVYLPCVESGEAKPARREAEGQLPLGTETVLLVEDEAAVRMLNARVLRAQGYCVIEAANGLEALQLVQADPATAIHLLLTDVVMPQMGGIALTEQLAAIHPGIKVLYTSGYTENLAFAQGRAGVGTGFIQKPASPAALARKVREVLDA